MAAVPDRLLAWLWSVIQNYRHPRLVNGHVAATLAAYIHFKPRTAVYTYDTGHSALLLCLSGPLSVPFRGAPYQYPLDIWVPEEYGEPGQGLLCYVRPAGGDTVIRPGQHVASDGRIYHPYLQAWNTGPTHRSSIVEFLSLVQELFTREPPLLARAQDRPPMPPPLPPKSAATSGPSLPPKPGAGVAEPPQSAERGPPLPPLPRQLAEQQQPRHTGSPPYNTMPTPASVVHHYASPPPLPVAQSHAKQQTRSHDTAVMASALQQSSQAWQHSGQQQEQRIVAPSLSQRPFGQALPSVIPATQATIRKPQQDLLSDLFDVCLPSITSSAKSAPPIPPNPEREQMCSLLSESLIGLANAKIERNQAAVQPLQAQNQALRDAHAKLNAELAQIQALDAVLSTNEPTIHQSLRDCDAVIASSKSVPEPNIDEFLVAPTVASQQLWTLCADEVAIREALWCLQRAIGAGRIGGADFVKSTRGLAREAFLKMALIRKIASGLGLDLGAQVTRS